MEKVPAYLVWYLFRIHRHSGEPDYFEKRFADKGFPAVARESQMNKDLKRSGLAAFPEDAMEKAFPPSGESRIGPATNGSGYPEGTKIVRFSRAFTTMPRGHYIVMEAIVGALGRSFWTVVTALLGIIVGLLISA